MPSVAPIKANNAEHDTVLVSIFSPIPRLKSCNTTVLLRFYPCLYKNLLNKNCSHLKCLKLRWIFVFWKRRLADASQVWKSKNSIKVNILGVLCSTLFAFFGLPSKVHSLKLLLLYSHHQQLSLNKSKSTTTLSRRFVG